MKRTLLGIAGLFGFVVASVALFAVVFALVDLRENRSARTISIGSKAFTESIVLAEVMAELIERKTDIRVIRRTNLGGTHIVFEALRAGEIDLYPEYTGTGLVAILKLSAQGDAERTFRSVSQEFSRRFALSWLAPMAFNNTYALAVTKRKSRELALERISDLTRHPGLVAGFASEFMAREDGYPGLIRRYGLELDARGMEAGLMYGAVATGEVDVISAYATDGRIDKFGLVVLEDDRGFFPPYHAAPLVRRETLEEFAEIAPALAVLAGKLTDAEMRRVNAAVDIGGRTPESVAAEIVARLLESEP